MTSLNDIRSTFIEYFSNNGHEKVKSSPLVPHNDPTLLFTNSGMVQFKDLFTGNETREYKKAVTSQKCVRAGGKHNDLDNVGYTVRHHTFFEMLGNFSFGDYFKDVAIDLAWKLVTKEFGISKEKLLVTVFSEDEESYRLWKSIAGLSDNKIIKIDTDDNFWRMGEVGPCGPCSEIFFDHGEKIFGGPPGSVNQDGDRFVEIWNLVFMQFEELENGNRISLPKPSIDTGMGLERISAILQGETDNYKTDLFKKLILTSAEISGVSAYGEKGVSHRVISDHLRSSSFLIADGVLPSNEGRGYVLRRIMRRAMRHIHILGTNEPMLYKLVPVLIQEMAGMFPELERAKPLILETLKLEETRFKKTLDRGLKLLDEEIQNLSPNQALPGETAFRLYDTYGFPIDLTQDVLKNKERIVDIDGFNKAMEKQKYDARAAWTGSGEKSTDEIWFSIYNEIGQTEFLGYNTTNSEGKILAIVKNGERINYAEKGSKIEIILNQSPFYAEAGGQVGDQGVLSNINGEKQIYVYDTVKRYGDIFVHLSEVKEGEIKTGDILRAFVDDDRRKSLMANHSATHLLQASLRKELGKHVIQKGSLVSEEKLRFDFSHPKPLSTDELERIENFVNEEIRFNSKIVTKLMNPQEAVNDGALALFGEKYGNEVRVVSMGSLIENRSYSTELCGGTHVNRTGDIGFFKIISENSVASGVRRIEAITGIAAQNHVFSNETLIYELAATLKTTPNELKPKIKNLLEQKKQIDQEIFKLRKEQNSGGSKNYIDDMVELDGVRFYFKNIKNLSSNQMKGIIDEIKGGCNRCVAVITTVKDDKISIVVGVTDDIVKTFNAVEIVKFAAQIVGGKGGGGRPDLAQAGGNNISKINELEKAIKEKIQSILVN